MSPATKIGIEEWLSWREMFATGVAAWAGGLALAVVAGWHLQSHGMANRATDEMASTAANSDALCDGVSTETPTPRASVGTIGSPGAVFLPEDEIVASRTPPAGATQMQRP